MGAHDPSATDQPGRQTSSSEHDTADSSVETVQTYAQRSVDSGALAGVLGGLFTLRALGAFRDGKWLQGLSQLLLGALLLAIARTQYRDAEGEAVPEDASRAEAPPQHSIETDATERETVEGTTDTDATERETVERFDRMGAAAFDEYSNEVPAPQQAFDLEFLSPREEVYWGLRESDDLVVCTQSYDDLDELPGVDYVASSRVDDERTLRVPDRIVNHWNELAETDVGVPGGTDIVFATTDTLRGRHCLAVVPEPWTEDYDLTA